MQKVRLLVHTWLVLDFFGESRRDGREGSALTTAIFGQSFAAFLLAAIMFEPALGLVPFAAANLSLSTVLVGIAALADPASEARRLADRQLFLTAPMGRWTVPIARALHAFLRTGFLAFGVSIPPAILCAFLREGSVWCVPAYLGLAVLLAALAAGALQVFVRGVTRFFGELRAALAAGTLRALLFALLFGGFVVGLPALRRGADSLPVGRDVLAGWPPFQAARWLADPSRLDAAGLLVGLAVGLLLIDAWIGDGAHDRATRRGRRARRSLLDRLEQSFAGEGRLRAMTAWTSVMLFRSAAFRARVLPLVGLPAAMIAVTFASEDSTGREMLLGVAMLLPAIGLPFLIAFLPRAEQEGADLVFRTSPAATLELAREGALIALALRVLLPLAGIGGIVLLAVDRVPVRALGLSAFAFGVAVLAAALALRRLESVPFTAPDDDPGGLELGALVPPAILFAFVGAGFGLIAADPIGPPVAALALAAAVLRLRMARRRSLRP